MADPRALQDSISRQRGLIPPSEDQFFGQEMKPQRSLVESILKYFYNANDPVGIGPTDLPISAGMVLSEKNIPVILQKLREVGGLSSTDEPLQYAKKFFSVKYPKLSRLVDEIFTSRALDNTGTYGVYNQPKNYITVNPYQGSRSMVETLGHELTHALQNSRGTLPLEAIQPELDFAGYANQLHEIQAARAGKTALCTHDKLAEKIAEYRRK